MHKFGKDGGVLLRITYSPALSQVLITSPWCSYNLVVSLLYMVKVSLPKECSYSQLRWFFPYQSIIIKIFPHRHAQRSISQVILDYVK